MNLSQTCTKLVSFLVVAAAISGCAVRPVKSGREGLFDKGDEKSGGGARMLSSEDGSGTVVKRMPPVSVKRLSFGWPVKKVEVTSRFGSRGDGVHEGIDLRAAVGTPVYAAQDGVVLHSGSQISGYGKMVVVRHDHGWATIYAHNSKLLVRGGQRVKKGQRIALSGQTGRASGPHVHFEVRNGVTAYDPIAVLVAGASRPAPAVPVIASAPRPDARTTYAARQIAERRDAQQAQTQKKVRSRSPSSKKKQKQQLVAQRDRVRTTQAAANRKAGSRKPAQETLKQTQKTKKKKAGAAARKAGRKPQSVEEPREKKKKPGRRHRQKRAVASAYEPG